MRGRGKKAKDNLLADNVLSRVESIRVLLGLSDARLGEVWGLEQHQVTRLLTGGKPEKLTLEMLSSFAASVKNGAGTEESSPAWVDRARLAELVESAHSLDAWPLGGLLSARSKKAYKRSYILSELEESAKQDKTGYFFPSKEAISHDLKVHGETFVDRWSEMQRAACQDDALLAFAILNRVRHVFGGQGESIDKSLSEALEEMNGASEVMKLCARFASDLLTDTLERLFVMEQIAPGNLTFTFDENLGFILVREIAELREKWRILGAMMEENRQTAEAAIKAVKPLKEEKDDGQGGR